MLATFPPCPPPVSSPAPACPAPASISSITLDAATLAVLQHEGADLARPPASLTKLMTAYVAYAALGHGPRAWAASTTIDADDVHAVAADETRMGLQPGERVSLHALLQGLMIVSGNDAALALARHLAGSATAYLQRMNACARQLGLRDTHFASVSGITTPGHVSSARDLAILSARLMADHPPILAVTAQRSFSHGGLHKHNQNGLLGDEGVDGLKTGYTQAAGHCLAATACRTLAAQASPRRLITVVLGAPSREQRHQYARDALAAGFAAVQAGTPRSR